MKDSEGLSPASFLVLFHSLILCLPSCESATYSSYTMSMASSPFSSFSPMSSNTQRFDPLAERRSSENTEESKDYWNIIPDEQIRTTLNFLQERYIASAVLHFIELSHNFSFLDGSATNTYCIRTSLDEVKYPISETIYKAFDKQARIALRTANILTNLLLHRLDESHSRWSSPANPIDGYHGNESTVLQKAFFWSLLKVNIESDPSLFGNGIAFRKGQSFPIRLGANNQSPEPSLDGSSKYEKFAPYIYRKLHKNGNEELKESGPSLVFMDLGKLPPLPRGIFNLSFSTEQADRKTENSYPHSAEWFKRHEEKDYSQFLNKLPKSSKSGMKISAKEGFWTSPYLDCGATNTWLVSYSVPFFGPSDRDPGTIDFKGVVVISINLREIDINQCSLGNESLFADTHRCDRETTQCTPIQGMGFRRGAYKCHCKPGYYIPSEDPNDSKFSAGSAHYRGYFNGTTVEEAFVLLHAVEATDSSNVFLTDFLCLPCPPGCETCINGSPCFVRYNVFLRSFALGLQSFCATITVVLAIVVFKIRRSKAIASSRWIMLEVMLFGAFLLYITVIIRYFEPTPMTCFIEPWFRELGFGFCFGAIVIKVYRIYAEFQTRKAHRVCVRDKDLLKYLSGIVLVVIGYMSSWSALVLDSINGISNIGGQRAANNIMEGGRTADGLRYLTCKELSWDYVTESGELCFLLTGIYLTYCIRNARPEIYDEKWTLCTCIYLETVVSTITYILKHIFWSKLHPDFIFCLCLIRCQLTVSVVVLLIIGPKIWYHNRPHSSKGRSKYFSSRQDRVPEVMKLQSAILSNGEVDIGDLNLSDMDPEDIRSELRRVYTQMQILRNKTMRKDNPHISKRRGGRKGTHRRFSLQPFHHKHKHVEQEVTEVSRTPEESTASFEGTSVVHPDGPSVVRVDSENVNGEK